MKLKTLFLNCTYLIKRCKANHTWSLLEPWSVVPAPKVYIMSVQRKSSISRCGMHYLKKTLGKVKKNIRHAHKLLNLLQHQLLPFHIAQRHKAPLPDACHLSETQWDHSPTTCFHKVEPTTMVLLCRFTVDAMLKKPNEK